MSKKECPNNGCRLGKVGGQAVIEGVMMKAGQRTVTTCRKGDGSIVVNDASFVSVRKKHKILNIPILRGIVNMIEMLSLSVKTLGASAEALGIEEEEGKFEKWMKKHLGVGLTGVVLTIGVILGVALSLLLFLFLPSWIADLANYATVTLWDWELGVIRAVIEGILKAAIFLIYLWAVALMPDIKRTFMYHGAEHKTIACYEAGEELTPENAMKHRRFHPRCGTSFMFFMILLGIVAGVFIRWIIPNLGDNWYRLIRLLILPLLVGLGYEYIMFAGKHDNIITRVLSAPGLWVQRLTTKEPTPDMLEIAIISTKCALRDEDEEFMEFYKSKAWIKEECVANAAENSAESDSATGPADNCASGCEVNAARCAAKAEDGSELYSVRAENGAVAENAISQEAEEDAANSESGEKEVAGE